jgi:hypothetical protein
MDVREMYVFWVLMDGNVDASEEGWGVVKDGWGNMRGVSWTHTIVVFLIFYLSASLGISGILVMTLSYHYRLDYDTAHDGMATKQECSVIRTL